jgi:hypothetical protein
MFTIKPRNEKRLIKEVVIGDEAKKLEKNRVSNPNQFGSSVEKIVVGGTQIREDKQLSPTPIASNANYEPISAEVGYISNYPVWAHIQAWLYYAMVPVFALQLYGVVSNQKDISEYTVADLTTSPDFTSQEVLIPVVSLLVIFFLVTCVYSGLNWLRYIGAIISAAAIGMQINLGYDFLINLQAKKPDLKGLHVLTSAFSETYFYMLALSIVVLLFTFVYLLIPKYQKSYKKPL